MGQYYNCLTKKGGEIKVYNLQVEGEDFTGVKLMEHSWWGNSFMSEFCLSLLNTKTRVAWVGDYATDFEWENEGRPEPKEERPEPKALGWLAWGGILEEQKIKNWGGLSLEDHYLVNHTKKIYLNGNEYYSNSVDKDGWCVHPLSLLTACGNGLGGGDYRGENMSDVGSWCMDEISVETEDNLKTYYPDYKEESYCFRES